MLVFAGRKRLKKSLSQNGRIERLHVARRMGHGNAIRPTFRRTRESMMRAAFGASMKNGIGQIGRAHV